ncbi:hypothetical protein [Bradyrhizobium sp. AZCC 1708]|uniref:hypothetical protein n=1 Tax=Bradyrhizobium sp. AZCC 1708 TaxID=3117015 RepID=UPI002FF18C4B
MNARKMNEIEFLKRLFFMSVVDVADPDVPTTSMQDMSDFCHLWRNVFSNAQKLLELFDAPEKE